MPLSKVRVVVQGNFLSTKIIGFNIIFLGDKEMKRPFVSMAFVAIILLTTTLRSVRGDSPKRGGIGETNHLRITNRIPSGSSIQATAILVAGAVTENR